MKDFNFSEVFFIRLKMQDLQQRYFKKTADCKEMYHEVCTNFTCTGPGLP
jgi:hypothetical protein